MEGLEERLELLPRLSSRWTWEWTAEGVAT